ncbi:MAG: hypothetical protein HYX47_01425 [Burkholderiales bacterium]|nr:hypothetical protein [Burkholderiales bacterium]
MNRENKTTNRFADGPRDRPHREGCEHANLERPGAQAHPRAAGWARALARPAGWRVH